tara:strand:- start:61761 stop:62237 length:477 start_codon:yes stop_codon:yes gene_type:complete
MKILLIFVSLSIGFVSVGQDDFVQTVQTAKQSLRDQLDTLSYDGSKVTYFKYRDKTYYKGLQIPVFLRENYVFFLSGAAADDKVTVQFFDKPMESNNRILLYEIKNISGNEAVIDLNELRKRITVYGESPESLRSVFIDYEIKKSRTERGAVVLVLGY